MRQCSPAHVLQAAGGCDRRGSWVLLQSRAQRVMMGRGRCQPCSCGKCLGQQVFSGGS